MSDEKQQFVVLDQAVKAKLVADATERAVSMNDIVVGLLARYYRIDFEPTGRHPNYPPGNDSATIVLRMPLALWRRLHDDAHARDLQKREIVGGLIAKHYDIAA